jgi:cytochrome o ubiquinol oxidase subunit 2
MKLSKIYRRFAAVAALAILMVLTTGCGESIIVLNPKGEVGKQQMDLMVITTLLCLIVIVPVLIITFVIIWRYRHRPGSTAKYTPEWEHSTKLETIWWGIPIIIIAIIGVITVKYTYQLEPSKPLASAKEPIVIQVASLDWKWLFLYPKQGIATVNYVQFPDNVPVRFELTSDAPMNSFWIPQLGGQIYTMSGMAMKLNLIADEPGDYMGSGANFSGKDFAQMKFIARASSQTDFDTWVAGVKKSSTDLTSAGYAALAQQGTSGQRAYGSFPPGLFNYIVNKYGGMPMGHSGSSAGSDGSMKMDDMQGMNMSADSTPHDH